MSTFQEIDYHLMTLREAMDYAQSLESRGDFKFKGIYSLFNNVYEATLKFQSNRILPDVRQLQREVTLPEDKFNEYIYELLGKGSIKFPALVAFPAIDFVSGNIVNLTILCRPTQQDGTSFKRYYDYYKSKTIDSFSKWISKKESK